MWDKAARRSGLLRHHLPKKNGGKSRSLPVSSLLVLGLLHSPCKGNANEMANAIGYASGGKSYHELAYSGEQQSATREKRGSGTNEEERQTAEHQTANHRLETGKREEWRDRENSSHREKNKG
jgi:hypothetical protein